jgi:hypothetical protein
MAGLPGGVTLDPTENAAAQQAALMIAANDELSHSPPSTWLDYSTTGAQAAAHSNLALGASGVTAIDLYMTDPGASNTFVGHRRWILDPPTRTMGIGDIPADSNALYVVQPQVPPAPSVTAVAWPPAGFVPAPLMPQRWSLQYDSTADFSHATVAVTENGAAQSVQILSDADNGYGGNAIVWDMPYAPSPQPGTQTVYTVNVGNVIVSGTPQSFSYTTTSFDPATTTALQPVPASVEFLQPVAQVSANADSIVIEVTRSMNAAGQVSVEYTTSNGTAISGMDYLPTSGTLTFAPGQFYGQIVVPILAGNLRSAGKTFSILLDSLGQASIGPVGATLITITASSGNSSPPPTSGGGGPITEPVVPDPPIVVGVLDLFQTPVAGHSRQGRRAATQLVGFKLIFNEPLDPASATSLGNYSLIQYQPHGRSLAAQSVRFHLSYDPAADSVSLDLIGKHPFPRGGRLILRASGTNGISNSSGALLAGNTRFSILPGAKSIVP